MGDRATTLASKDRSRMRKEARIAKDLRILKAFKSGDSTTELAARFGVRTNVITDAIRRAMKGET